MAGAWGGGGGEMGPRGRGHPLFRGWRSGEASLKSWASEQQEAKEVYT